MGERKGLNTLAWTSRIPVLVMELGWDPYMSSINLADAKRPNFTIETAAIDAGSVNCRMLQAKIAKKSAAVAVCGYWLVTSMSRVLGAAVPVWLASANRLFARCTSWRYAS